MNPPLSGIRVEIKALSRYIGDQRVGIGGVHFHFVGYPKN